MAFFNKKTNKTFLLPPLYIDACYAALITDICRSKRDEIAALMEEMPVLLYQVETR